MTDRPARSETIDINPVADGYVVYDTAADMVHYLNHTASMVLELCNGQDTVAQIAALLAGVFTDVADVQNEVVKCVDQLRSLGLVQPAQPGPTATITRIPVQAPPPDRAAADS